MGADFFQRLRDRLLPFLGQVLTVSIDEVGSIAAVLAVAIADAEAIALPEVYVQSRLAPAIQRGRHVWRHLKLGKFQSVDQELTTLTPHERILSGRGKWCAELLFGAVVSGAYSPPRLSEESAAGLNLLSPATQELDGKARLNLVVSTFCNVSHALPSFRSRIRLNIASPPNSVRGGAQRLSRRSPRTRIYGAWHKSQQPKSLAFL